MEIDFDNDLIFYAFCCSRKYNTGLAEGITDWFRRENVRVNIKDNPHQTIFEIDENDYIFLCMKYGDEF